MFWKKTINALCLSFIVMSLMGCGSSANLSNQITEAEENSSAEVTDKGSRNNPYKIGDIITLNDISPVYPYGKLNGYTFSLSFVVDESYSPSESISIMKKRYDTFTAVPAAKVTFTLDGNYDDEIIWVEAFKVSIISEEMETYSYSMFDDCDDLSQKSTVFTGYEYTYYALTNHDTSTDVTPVSKYLVVEYADADANTHSLYISLESPVADESLSETNE